MSGVLEGTTEKRSKRKSVLPGGLAISIALAGIMLASCASYERDHVIVGSTPTDYRTRHPIVISEAEVSEDLVVSHTMRNMSNRQENVVRNFASRFRRSGSRSLIVLVPSGSPNEVAARKVAGQVVNLMRELDVDRSQIKLSSYHASGHGEAATVRMSFNAMSAEVASRCGKWEEDLTDTKENYNYGNFGCATQNNLAKMVANPEDFLGPRGESEIDATRRDNVISDWRENGSEDLRSAF